MSAPPPLGKRATLLAAADFSRGGKHASGWPAAAFYHLRSLLESVDPPFPCIYGVSGWQRDALRFAIADDGKLDDLAQALGEYARLAPGLGDHTTLVVFFPPAAAAHQTLEQQAARFWAILQQLHNRDRYAWPADFPSDPCDPGWEFCFAGQPFFVPANPHGYVRRRSRGGFSFGMMFQPRWVFERLAEDPGRMHRARAAIRARAERFDDLSVHPAIGVYGDSTNAEWRQYFLPDDNGRVLNRCPFRAGGSDDTRSQPDLQFVPVSGGCLPVTGRLSATDRPRPVSDPQTRMDNAS
jgi:hypothetical protein